MLTSNTTDLLSSLAKSAYEISKQYAVILIEIIYFLFIINKTNIHLFIFNPLFQESEPISNYLSADISQEVKQRIARMGVDTLLKMVRYIIH